METRHLRAFLKIAETRSISRAAESLGLSQPSLSQQLLRLEDEVGVQLFRRTPRGVIVTEAGRVFQEHARQILRAESQALEDVRQLRGGASGQAILAVPPSLAAQVGVPLVRLLREECPEVTVRLVESFTGNIRGWLERGQVDLGVLHEQGPLRNLTARRLLSEELVLAGPPGAFASGEHVAIARLGEFPLIVPGAQHGLRQVIDHEVSRLGGRMQVAHEIDALGQITALVASGEGFALLPRAATAGLSVASIGGGALRRTLCLVRNPAQVLTHASVRVEDALVRVIGERIESGEWAARIE